MNAEQVASSIQHYQAEKRTWEEQLFTRLIRRRYLLIGATLAVGITAVDVGLSFAVVVFLAIIDFRRERVLSRLRYKEQLLKIEKIFNTPSLSEQWYRDLDARRAEATGIASLQDWQRNCLGAYYQADTSLASVHPTALQCKYWLSSYIGKNRITGLRIADLGCQNGVGSAYFRGGHTFLPHSPGYNANSIANQVFAVDIMRLHARRVWGGLGIPAAVASVTAVPFRTGQFDIVAMVEILEHLHSPVDSLREAFRISKPGGRLILTTPNRHGLQFDQWLNPTIFVVHLLTLLRLEFLLPLAQLTYEDEGEPAYHTNFTKQELKSLLEAAGFAIVEFGTFAFFTGLDRVLGRVFSITLGQYAFWLHRLEAWLAKIPVIRLLGTHWFVIASASRPAASQPICVESVVSGISTAAP